MVTRTNNEVSVRVVLLLLIAPIAAQGFIAISLVLDLVPISIIFFLTTLLLSEAHFASTFRFFVSRSNRNWYVGSTARVWSVILGCCLSLILGLASVPQLLLWASIFSGFHVVRQAVGIKKIIESRTRKKSSNWSLYAGGASCLLLASLKFSIIPPTILNLIFPQRWSKIFSNDKFYLFAGLATLILLVIYVIVSQMSVVVAVAVLHGGLTYAPYLLFDNQLVGHLVAVSSHWLQYIILLDITTSSVVEKTHSVNAAENRRDRPLRRYGEVAFICIYSVTMTMIFVSNVDSSLEYGLSRWLIVPILMHIVHYIIDGHIWRFGDPYLAMTVGRRISALVKI